MLNLIVGAGPDSPVKILVHVNCGWRTCKCVDLYKHRQSCILYFEPACFDIDKQPVAILTNDQPLTVQLMIFLTRKAQTK